MRIIFSALIAAASIVLSSSAGAQEFVSLDAHVFDKSNLKPLENAIVELRYVNDSGSGQLSLSTVTDINGLATIITGSVPTSFDMRAEIEVFCNTRKGLIRQTTRFIQLPQQRSVFERNFYLALPRNIHGCIYP